MVCFISVKLFQTYKYRQLIDMWEDIVIRHQCSVLVPLPACTPAFTPACNNIQALVFNAP